MTGATALANQQLGVLRRYLGNRYADNTIRAFISQSAAFIRHVGAKPVYSRDDVLSFVGSLVARGYSSGSITTMVAGVRSLFRALRQAWPLDRADMHLGLPVEEGGGPAIAPEEVAALISRAHLLAYPDLQLLALASVWGFRNSELARVLTEGCDGTLLNVRTSKSGRVRLHGVPDRLASVLRFGPREIGVDGVHKRFDVVMKRCLRPPAPGEGWHAFRRSLATGLNRSGLDHYYLHRFMGWKVAETGFVYFRADPAEIDAKVYSVHPFLPLWPPGQAPTK